MGRPEAWYRDRRTRTVYRCPECDRRIMWRFRVMGVPGAGDFEWQGKRAPVAYLDDGSTAIRCFACGWGRVYAPIDFRRAWNEGHL